MFNLKKVGQMAINRWMETHRWWYIPTRSYYLAIRKGQTTDAWSTGESQKQDVVWEKPKSGSVFFHYRKLQNTDKTNLWWNEADVWLLRVEGTSPQRAIGRFLFGVVGELSWLEWSHQCLPLQMGTFYVREFKLNKADSWRRKRGP